LILLLIISSGCDHFDKKSQEKGNLNKNAIQIIDDVGDKVEFNESPQRVICLSPSYLNLIDAVGGKIIGKSDSQIIKMPKEYESADDVGLTGMINIEKVISLRPDCVIGIDLFHNKFVRTFEDNKIKKIFFQGKKIEDIKRALKKLGVLYGQKDKANKAIARLENNIELVTNNFRYKNKKIVILHATARGVTVELDGSIAGCVAKKLKLNNIASDDLPLNKKSYKIPFSLEVLLVRNPDIIFVTIMGDIDKIKAKFISNIQNNPAWNSLEAVKKRTYYFFTKRFIFN
jgi:iron complex transport system substrate-binding protein